MSIPILEACRKRKRRPKLYGFHSFGNPGYPINPIGPFRDNVRVFLQNCAELEEYNIQGMPIWCTLLVHENRSLVIPLYTIEEDVEQSPRPYCDQCRCTGLWFLFIIIYLFVIDWILYWVVLIFIWDSISMLFLMIISSFIQLMLWYRRIHSHTFNKKYSFY